MNNRIRSLPPDVQAKLAYTQEACPSIEVYPEEGGGELFQLYRRGLPMKDPQSARELIAWLEGFREGILECFNGPLPYYSQGNDSNTAS
jgi:hypothetical protein